MIIVIDAREITVLSEIINTLSNQDFVELDKIRWRTSLGIIKEMGNSMSDFLNSRFSTVMANSSAGSSAGKCVSLSLDKRQSLESKLVGASSEKISCLQKTIFIEPVQRRWKSDLITKWQRIESFWKAL